MIHRRERSRGFTVAELVVAMSISAVTLLSGYELLQALKATGDRQSADLAATAEIVRGLRKIRDDLLHALPRPGPEGSIFVGVSPELEEVGETTRVLRFSSLCPGDGHGFLPSLRRTYQVRYELAKIEESLCLYRSAIPVVGADQASNEGGRALILDRIDRITFAFHNGQSLESDFSSDERLPVGMEITVQAYDQPWLLAVKLPCGGEEGGL